MQMISHATTKLTFSLSTKMNGTQVDNGKFMKYVLYTLWYAKRHLSDCSDIEQWKIKPIILAIELHNQAVSH